MAQTQEARSGIVQPLAPGNEIGGCSARALYCVLAILRMGSYAFALWLYCESGEDGKAGSRFWLGRCKNDPPTLSTASSYLGVHGPLRSLVCIVACVVQVIIIWVVLRFVYGEMLHYPPLPRTFSTALVAWCVLEIVQVVTAHSTEHYIIASLYFTGMILALIFFFHGTLASNGFWGQGVTGALPAAVLCFLAVIGLCIYMFVKIMIMSLPYSSWVMIEYITAVLLIGMHVCIGLALPRGLSLYLRNSCCLHIGDATKSSSATHEARLSRLP